MSEPAAPNARCPRCGGEFRCGAADADCACFELKLDAGLREQVARSYADCLCVNCLLELQRQQGTTAPAAGA